MTKWSDRAAQKARRDYKTQCQETDALCWLCGQPINYHAPAYHPDSFELDHFYPRASHPDLALDESNFRPSHASCNRARGKKDPPLPLGKHSATW